MRRINARAEFVATFKAHVPMLHFPIQKQVTKYNLYLYIHMMVNEPIFNSITEFHTFFMQGLDLMLQNENLDTQTFNLVFGNTILHHNERDMIARLEAAKKRLAATVDQTKTDDDTQIFLKLKDMKLDWQNWTMTEDRKINSWNVQLNKFRVLKPKGYGVKKISNTFQKFNSQDFNFNKIKNPPIWQGTLLKRNMSLYYNKFPYKDLQSILVLDPQLNKEQFLTESDHVYIWNLCLELKHLYNLYIGYNSLGAFASINHLHFHLVVGIEELTIVQNKWSHNSGAVKYPATVYVFETAAKAWDLIKQMNSQNVPYNLLYMPGKIYIYPKKFQGTYEDPLWSTGLGWYELSGNFIIYDEKEIDLLTDQVISQSLEKASLKFDYKKNAAEFMKVARVSDLKDGMAFCSEINGQKLALFKIGNTFHAISNVCTHAGGPLCEGQLSDGIVTCPWHGSKFDVTSGQVKHPPAINPVKHFQTRVNGDAIEVALDQ